MKKRILQIISVLLIICMLPLAAFAENDPAEKPEGPVVSSEIPEPEGTGTAEEPSESEGPEESGNPEGTTETTEAGETDGSEEPEESHTSESSGEPEEPEEPEEPKNPEDQFEYPHDWSEEPLRFAVKNGILKGDDLGNLNPGQNATRAEMAAILVRLLGASEKASLDAFTDVDPSAWYCEELSAALASGLFNGMSPTLMAPNAPITREQALVVVSRAFGVVTDRAEIWRRFSDSKKISGYARDAVSAMYDVGACNGYGDNTLRPQNYITRAEIASLLYHLLSAIAEVPEDIPAEGWVLYRGTEDLPSGFTLQGSLVVGQNYPAQFSPKGWKMDHLVLHTGSETDVDLSGLDAKSLVFAPISGSGRGNVPQVWLGGDSNYEGATDSLTVTSGSHRAVGDCKKLSVLSGTLNLKGNADKVLLASRNTLSLTGNADHIRTGENVKFTMDGNAKDLTVGKDSSVEVNGSVPGVFLESGASLALRGDARAITLASGASISLGGRANRVAGGNNCVISVGGNTDLVKAGESCTVTLNGNAKEVVVKNHTNLVVNGKADRVTITGTNIHISGSGHIGTLTFDRKPYTCTVPCDVLDDSAYRGYYKDYDEALDVVQTQRVPCTAKKDTKLYKSRDRFDNLGDFIQDIPEGTIVYNEYHPKGNSFQVSFTDSSGKAVTGWVPRWDFYIPDEEVVTWDGELDYSKGTKEGFVDKMGYSSKTNRLIWVSRYTQKVIIFHGKQGDWHLDETFPCSSGANNTPTPAGIHEIITHPHRWNFTGYYVDHVTAFYGDHAFHSVLKNYGGGYYDDTVGIPLSHGCVRMPNEGAAYIEDENNIPTGTTVIVW